jgi:hypothetical protein
MFGPAAIVTSLGAPAFVPFSDPCIQSIAPMVTVWNLYRLQSSGGIDSRNDIAIHAVRNWVNDSPVDDVRMNPPQSVRFDNA